MTKKDEKSPYFIQMRGCINCDASKRYKEKYGKDYGFDHEIIAGCLIMGCRDYGYDLTNPFFDPEEIIRLAKKDKNKLDEKQLENIRRYLKNANKKFGEHYKKIGISIDKLLEEI